MNKSMRKVLPAEVFENPEKLAQALGNILDDIYQKLANIAPRRSLTIPLQTRATVAASFPITFSNPGFNMTGLTVVKIDNQDNPSDTLTGGVTAQWEKSTDGNGVIRFITGLSANTRYLIELEAIGGK